MRDDNFLHRYAMNPNLQIYLSRDMRYQRVPTDLEKEYETEYREYYSPTSFLPISKMVRPQNRILLSLILGFFAVFVIFLIMFRGNGEEEIFRKMEELSTREVISTEVKGMSRTESIKIRAETMGISKSQVQLAFQKYIESIDPTEKYPDDVNFVKPHHIRVIAAMGDSLTIGCQAENIIGEPHEQYPGNAYFTGMDTEVDEHLTIYNTFRVITKSTGTKIFGGSTGEDYGKNTGLNVAVSGMKSDDIRRQAEDLVTRIRENTEIDIENDWKLVSLWIGTNDVGNLGFGDVDPIPVNDYKKNIEDGLLYLKENLPKTIVSIIGMFPAQLLQEAQSIIKTGKRARSEENQRKLDELSDGYRKVSYELQDERKFDSKNFTVVVQPFATEYTSAFVDKMGSYSSAFYARDLFHLSKLGHSIIAKHYWQNLFEPVGAKTKKAELGDISPQIFELDENNSFIKTVGNSGSREINETSN